MSVTDTGTNMEIHENFTRWAVGQGVTIDGVQPHLFPGKGMGLMATKDFEIGDTMIDIPIKALRKISDVPSHYSKTEPGLPVHGLLALSLDSLIPPPWQAVLPTQQDIQASMPFCWDSELQALLPYTSSALLEKQKVKITSAWDIICKAFAKQPITRDEFVYNYLIVNSRTFYYLSPNVRSRPLPPKEDRLALNPFADYVNHSSSPTCTATLSSNGYNLMAIYRIPQGSEIHISYGSHSNDFLLAEYGFILEDNRWDEVSLDAWILPLLNRAQEDSLRETSFLGNYVLDRDTICYRTQVVLRILCLPLGRWKRFVNGLEDEDASKEAADRVLVEVLTSGKSQAAEMIERSHKLEAGLDDQRETLRRRWNQIIIFLDSALRRI